MNNQLSAEPSVGDVRGHTTSIGALSDCPFGQCLGLLASPVPFKRAIEPVVAINDKRLGSLLVTSRVKT